MAIMGEFIPGDRDGADASGAAFEQHARAFVQRRTRGEHIVHQQKVLSFTATLWRKAKASRKFRIRFRRSKCVCVDRVRSPRQRVRETGNFRRRPRSAPEISA